VGLLPRSSPTPKHPTDARFGTKVVVVDAAPKVIWIAAALVALLAW
jgi:hypothetical protein